MLRLQSIHCYGVGFFIAQTTPSHHKRTALESIWNCTETTSSKGSRWCSFYPLLSAVTPARTTAPRGENELEFDLNRQNTAGVKTLRDVIWNQIISWSQLGHTRRHQSLPRTMTLTDMTRQKSSLRASASRFTDAGRKSYLFSANRTKCKDTCWASCQHITVMHARKINTVF